MTSIRTFLSEVFTALFLYFVLKFKLFFICRKHCTPTCKQGCVNGTCVQPDVCQCNFGYVGQNCSIMCKCNGHSHCPGVDQLDVCLKCMNNTMVRI